MDLMDRLSQYRSEEAKLRWEGSFADYFELVKKNPKISRLAHARIFDMIMADGVEPEDTEQRDRRGIRNGANRWSRAQR